MTPDQEIRFAAWLAWQARLLDSQVRFEGIDFIRAKWLRRDDSVEN